MGRWDGGGGWRRTTQGGIGDQAVGLGVVFLLQGLLWGGWVGGWVGEMKASNKPSLPLHPSQSMGRPLSTLPVPARP